MTCILIDATTVLDLKAFYFLDQAIPDIQREVPGDDQSSSLEAIINVTAE